MPTAAIMCLPAKKHLVLCYSGWVGNRGCPVHHQELRRHPGADLQVVGGCQPVEAQSAASQTEAAHLEARPPRQEGCAHQRGSLRSGATTDVDGFLAVADRVV